MKSTDYVLPLEAAANSGFSPLRFIFTGLLLLLFFPVVILYAMANSAVRKF